MLRYSWKLNLLCMSATFKNIYSVIITASVSQVKMYLYCYEPFRCSHVLFCPSVFYQKSQRRLEKLIKQGVVVGICDIDELYFLRNPFSVKADTLFDIPPFRSLKAGKQYVSFPSGLFCLCSVLLFPRYLLFQ